MTRSVACRPGGPARSRAACVAMVARAMSSWAPTSAYREEGSLLALVPVYAAFLWSTATPLAY